MELMITLFAEPEEAVLHLPVSPFDFDDQSHGPGSPAGLMGDSCGQEENFPFPDRYGDRPSIFLYAYFDIPFHLVEEFLRLVVMIVLPGIRTSHHHHDVIPGLGIQVAVSHGRPEQIPVLFDPALEVKWTANHGPRFSGKGTQGEPVSALPTFVRMSGLVSQLELLRSEGKKGLAVLLDPDRVELREIPGRLEVIRHARVDWILVGGSLLTSGGFAAKLAEIRRLAPCPVVLFPGSPAQVHPDADGILFLTLISGRNAELLIGHHVQAAAALRGMNLEIIPTGYMLVDGGAATTASYISQTIPIPPHKPDIAAMTALAGQYLGLRCLYLDTGSGSPNPVPHRMISAVREATSIPLIVGGGLRTAEDLFQAYASGADLAVVGTAFEHDPEVIFRLRHRQSL